MPKTLCFGKRGLAIRILMLIHPSKLIRQKYKNHPNTHKLENLVLIVEDETKIRINRGVSNVYMFLHAYSEGVEFYAARQYVHLTKELREGELFCIDE